MTTHYTIFQPDQADDEVTIAFAFNDDKVRMASTVAAYRLALAGTLEHLAADAPLSIEQKLETIFVRHQDRPGQRSLSKGDVVVLNNQDVYICAAFGWMRPIGRVEALRFRLAAADRTNAPPAMQLT
jgi:hypothetical protein